MCEHIELHDDLGTAFHVVAAIAGTQVGGDAFVPRLEELTADALEVCFEFLQGTAFALGPAAWGDELSEQLVKRLRGWSRHEDEERAMSVDPEWIRKARTGLLELLEVVVLSDRGVPQDIKEASGVAVAGCSFLFLRAHPTVDQILYTLIGLRGAPLDTRTLRAFRILERRAGRGLVAEPGPGEEDNIHAMLESVLLEAEKNRTAREAEETWEPDEVETPVVAPQPEVAEDEEEEPFVTRKDAAKLLGYSPSAFDGRVRRKSPGFERLGESDNRRGRGMYRLSAVLKCPRHPDSDPELLEAFAEELAKQRQAKRKYKQAWLD